MKCSYSCKVFFHKILLMIEKKRVICCRGDLANTTPNRHYSQEQEWDEPKSGPLPQRPAQRPGPSSCCPAPRESHPWETPDIAQDRRAPTPRGDEELAWTKVGGVGQTARGRAQTDRPCLLSGPAGTGLPRTIRVLLCTRIAQGLSLQEPSPHTQVLGRAGRGQSDAAALSGAVGTPSPWCGPAVSSVSGPHGFLCLPDQRPPLREGQTCPPLQLLPDCPSASPDPSGTPTVHHVLCCPGPRPGGVVGKQEPRAWAQARPRGTGRPLAP